MREFAYFLIDALSGLCIPGGGRYLGIDRHPWRCVDEAYYSGQLSAEEFDSLSRARVGFVGNLSFGTFNNVENVLALAKSCSSAAGATVLVVECLGRVNDLSPSLLCDPDCGSLGIDVYLDGYGSPISLGILSRHELFADDLGALNKNGLFDDIANVNKYLSRYAEVELKGDIEPLSGMGDIWAYVVHGEIQVE